MGIPFPLFLAAKLLGSVLIVADTPPKFNVGPSCKTAAAITQAMSLAVTQDYQTCMKDEESARQELVQNWSKYRAQDRTLCAAQAQVGGTPSYVEVLACLDTIPSR